jgi:hypothetical protein
VPDLLIAAAERPVIRSFLPVSNCVSMSVPR